MLSQMFPFDCVIVSDEELERLGFVFGNQHRRRKGGNLSAAKSLKLILNPSQLWLERSLAFYNTDNHTL